MTFRILEHQMHALGRETQAGFLARMERFLGDHLPHFVAEVWEQGVSGWLAEALAVAHESDITTEPEAAQLILLFTVIGVDSGRRLPWVQEVLEDETLIPVGKLTRLVTEGQRRHPGIERVVVYPEYRALLTHSQEVAP